MSEDDLDKVIMENNADADAWDRLVDEMRGSELTADEARRRWESQPKLLEAVEYIKPLVNSQKSKPFQESGIPNGEDGGDYFIYQWEGMLNAALQEARG